MSPTWRSEDEPQFPPLRILDWARVAVRGVILAVVLIIGVVLTVLVRAVEWPVCGMTRPGSGWITVSVCRAALKVMRLRVEHKGTPMQRSGIYAANHSTWLDIFVLNSGVPMYFVSKAEVAAWPGIGWLARLTGTVFVRRSRQEADAQRAMIEERIVAGHRLTLFPEGTSTDGQRVLGFKPTLFAALFSEQKSDVHVQPVSVAYWAPSARDARFYGWWGDMEFGPHLLQMLAQKTHGHVQVTWHPPLAVGDFSDRKSLAKTAEKMVRRAHPYGGESSV